VAKRFLDIVLGGLLGILTLPVTGIAAIAVRLSDGKPVFYRPQRSGRNGEQFTLHKFRTMRVRPAHGSAITSVDDDRIFRVGQLLRSFKIDELPQLYDVVRGRMSIVGPRPEDPDIVERYYTAEDRTTLSVRPGLLGPGSIWNYTHGEALLAGDPDPEQAYVRSLLPVKLALDRVYLRRASIGYDISLMARTARVIVLIALGRRDFPPPPEMDEAMALLRDREGDYGPRP